MKTYDVYLKCDLSMPSWNNIILIKLTTLLLNDEDIRCLPEVWPVHALHQELFLSLRAGHDVIQKGVEDVEVGLSWGWSDDARFLENIVSNDSWKLTGFKC